MKLKKIISIDNIDIIVEKKKNIKNIYMKVKDKTGVVKITAPYKLSLSKIKEIAYQNIDNIKKRRSTVIEKIKRVEKKYISGEKHYFFGKEYILKVNNDKKQFLIENNTITLSYRGEINSKKTEKIFKDNMKKILLDKVENLVLKYSFLMNVEVKEIRLKTMKTRWGTCNINKKRIWINSQLISFPIECLEHVVVHEMVHLLEKNHTKRFYFFMDMYYPKWKEIDIETNKFAKENIILGNS